MDAGSSFRYSWIWNTTIRDLLDPRASTRWADAFREIVEAAGYKFAIYCNVDWYENVICSHLKKYDFWIGPAIRPTMTDGFRNDSGQILAWAGSIAQKPRFQASAEL